MTDPYVVSGLSRTAWIRNATWILSLGLLAFGVSAGALAAGSRQASKPQAVGPASTAPALPCVHWTQGPDTAPVLKEAGITRLCVPPDTAPSWQQAGFAVTPMTDEDVAGREMLAAPGIAPRSGVASPTRAPWVVANGWRFRRNPSGKYVYELPAGKGALAAAEAFTYGVDAVLKIDPADGPETGRMMTFLAQLPASALPSVADLAVVDDGSPITGEVMNLLTRRNLLYDIVKSPSRKFAINVKVGSKDYPEDEAADPSTFALKIRRQLTDEKRTLRVFGSEVVISRLTGNADRVRLQLLNYGAREIEGLRIRLLGRWEGDQAHVAGSEPVALRDHVMTKTTTEFSLPTLRSYAVVDLRRASRP
jgi:hypothetical protein